MLFLSLAALIEFVGIKEKMLHESFAPKKRDKTPPSWLWLSLVTEKFMGVMEAKSSWDHAVVPQGNPLIS